MDCNGHGNGMWYSNKFGNLLTTDKNVVHYEIFYVLGHDAYFNLGLFQSGLLLTARYERYISPKSYVATSTSNRKFKQNSLVFLEMEHADRPTNSQYMYILWVLPKDIPALPVAKAMCRRVVRLAI
jgi:hypothetical protein